MVKRLKLNNYIQKDRYKETVYLEEKNHLCIKDNKAYIQLDNDKLNITVVVPKELSLGAVPGHKVLVKVTNKLQGNTYNGQILKILGHKTDPGVDILSITAKYNINDEFSEEVMAEVDKLPDEVKEEEMIGREDLREEIIFTIDGDDTKDIDDAISIERLENNNFKLGVHIADVSYYVKDNTKLDEEAYNRGTSVYLADRVIPMLPRKLSNGICSLNPNVDRLAMSCVMEIDEKGNVVDYNIFESVIRSKKQMTYKNVNKIMEENKMVSSRELALAVCKALAEKNGMAWNSATSDLCMQQIQRGGYHIYTPYSAEVQAAVDKIYTDMNEIPEVKNSSKLNSAIVIPKSAELSSSLNTAIWSFPLAKSMESVVAVLFSRSMISPAAIFSG